jgi:hypothetical protein
MIAVERLVEWESLELRVSGAKLSALAASFRVPPVESLSLTFHNGLLRVNGVVRKWVPLPFSIEIRELVAAGSRVRVPLASARAFGALPIPGWLVGLFRDRLPRELIEFEEPATLVISLDRFLPPFIDAPLRNIWIIEGGLAVTLGRGGADLPPQPGGDHRPENAPAHGPEHGPKHGPEHGPEHGPG